MHITQLERRYEAALRPIFGSRFRLQHDRDDFVTIVLDGEQEEFFFTLYGVDHLRLYWDNECFIFDRRRNDLVFSDTYGEIVYEGPVDSETLPDLVIPLILRLKDCAYLSKEETVTGKTPSGYDDIRKYKIRAKTWAPCREPFQMENILIEFLPHASRRG